MDYKSRIIDDLLDLKLEAFGATLIKGPKVAVKQPRQNKKQKVSWNFRMKK